MEVRFRNREVEACFRSQEAVVEAHFDNLEGEGAVPDKNSLDSAQLPG